MYYDSKISIPNVTGKITISRKKYVMYETGRKYHADKKYNIPERVTIGKLCGEDGMMMPNENYFLYFPDETVQETDSKIKRSSCLKIGTFLVVKKILEEYGLDMLIDSIFDDSGLFMDLIMYSIVEENNAGQYYPDYAYNHPLFTPNQKIYSDTKVSGFFKSITDDQRIDFIDKWNAKKDHKNRIYISYDSTNKNCQAGEINLAEYGHAKADKTKPVINYSIGYDHNNKEPLFYEEYPGSIVDISQLDYMINKAAGMGYKNIGFVLDRGYFCKNNLRHLDEKGYPFIIMAKGNTKFINGFVKKVEGSFEEDRRYRISKYRVNGKTVKGKLFNTEETERYIHVYFNLTRAAAERENFETKIGIMDRNFKKLIGTKTDTSGLEDYFRFEKDKEGVIAAVFQKNNEIEKCKKRMGYFVIVTSRRMSAKEALYLYKSRDESEKLFRADKSYLGNRTYRVQIDESIKGKTLVEFVALIVRNKIFTYLDETVEENVKKANYLTVPAAIRELEKIEIVRQSDGLYRLDHAVTATQKIILKAFGISASSIPGKAKYLANELAKVDKISLSVKKTGS